MISFPNAKINLGLQILGKRSDGFHDIESCLYPINLCDLLEIVKSDEFEFSSSGLSINDSSDTNLVVKAFNLLTKHRQLTPVTIHLHKEIPMGAGLGGGSSDGAYALKMLNDLFKLDLSTVQLKSLASELGSDCPFFIENLPSIATGTGTSSRAFDLDLSDYEIRLEHPSIHISTKEAYSLVIPSQPKNSIQDILEMNISQWSNHLVNDFEKPILFNHPHILEAKNKLLNEGALYASMTGSGASVFGIFPKHS